MSEFDKSIILWQSERTAEVKAVLGVISQKMVLPLYFLFWIADIVLLPANKWELLLIRSAVIPVIFIINKAIPKIQNYKSAQYMAITYTVVMSTIINAIMIGYLPSNTSYYAGLNLVAMGSISFIPLEVWSLVTILAGIYTPYLFWIGVSVSRTGKYVDPIISLFFIVGTVAIAVIIRYFQNNLRKNELLAKSMLEQELASRSEIIQQKTEEGIKLAALSSQFSPQIVEAIKSGKINLSVGTKRSQICSIFIDIVGSTERVVRLDKDKVYRSISMFMEDSIKTLLKYDITIVQFLGDGILAFSNEPVQHKDYIDRVVTAAAEIRERINARQDEYETYWMNKLEIRVGISSGHANVGFFGNDKYFRAYTAMGSVMNLASRLCSTAEPGQIVVSHDVYEKLDANKYDIISLGKKTLKGFDADVIKTYAVNSFKHAQLSKDLNEIDCPKCSAGIMYLDTNELGIFVFKCRNCGSTFENTAANFLTKQSA